MLCSTKRVSSTCSGALTSDMSLAAVEKTIMDTSDLYAKFELVSVVVPC